MLGAYYNLINKPGVPFLNLSTNLRSVALLGYFICSMSMFIQYRNVSVYVNTIVNKLSLNDFFNSST